MRRRPIILLLLAAGALAVVGVALADPPQTTTAVKTLGESPDAQVGPAIAVDPAGGTNVRAVALDSDWRSGPLQAQTGYATGTISSTSGATTWVDRGFLSSFDGSDISGGSPDVIWGPGNKVYAVEVGRDISRSAEPVRLGGGLYYSFSLDGGTTWNTYHARGEQPEPREHGPVGHVQPIDRAHLRGVHEAGMQRRRLRHPRRHDGRRRKRRPAHRERLPDPGAA